MNLQEYSNVQIGFNPQPTKTTFYVFVFEMEGIMQNARLIL